MTPGGAGREQGAFGLLGVRLGRHSVAYGVQMVAVAVLGLVTLAVFTRFMAPSEYGRLIILLFLSTALEMLYTLGIYQGTIGAVFGKGEDGPEEEFPQDEEHQGNPAASGKRETMGTGLLLVSAISISGTAIAWPLAPAISQALLADALSAGAVRWALVAGATAALFRLVVGILRFERRPPPALTLSVARPVIALGVAVPLLSAGLGAEGALMGLVAAYVALISVGLVWIRSSYRLAFVPAALPVIFRLGAVFVPIVLSMFVIQHAGVLVLARQVPNAEVGLFGVGARIGEFLLFYTTAFFMAYMPLKRVPAFQAAHKQKGHAMMTGALATWFVLGAVTVLVVLTLAASLLVQIADRAYEEAAGLIPLTGAAALTITLWLFIRRLAVFMRKRLVLACVSVFMAVLFVPLAVVFVSGAGIYGVPLAVIVAVLTGTAIVTVFSQRGTQPIAFEYSRLVRLAFVAGICIVAQRVVGASGVVALARDLAVAAAYPALLLATRVISVRDMKRLGAIVRQALRPRRWDRAELVARLTTLPEPRVHSLKMAVDSERPDGLPTAFYVDVVEALRQVVARNGGSTSQDAAIGRYLLSPLSRAERDVMMRALWRGKADPLELDDLESAFDALRRLPDSAWPSRPVSSAGRDESPRAR